MPDLLAPETTLAEIAASDALLWQLASAIMPSVRGAMWAERLSYDRADKIAESVAVGVREGLRRRITEREPTDV